MPRYFFHTRDRNVVFDEDGIVLSDTERAREMAVATAGDMLKHSSDLAWDAESWRMWVTDEAGETVCELVLSARTSGQSGTRMKAA